MLDLDVNVIPLAAVWMYLVWSEWWMCLEEICDFLIDRAWYFQVQKVQLESTLEQVNEEPEAKEVDKEVEKEVEKEEVEAEPEAVLVKWHSFSVLRLNKKTHEAIYRTSHSVTGKKSRYYLY